MAALSLFGFFFFLHNLIIIYCGGGLESCETCLAGRREKAGHMECSLKVGRTLWIPIFSINTVPCSSLCNLITAPRIRGDQCSIVDDHLLISLIAARIHVYREGEFGQNLSGQTLICQHQWQMERRSNQIHLRQLLLYFHYIWVWCTVLLYWPHISKQRLMKESIRIIIYFLRAIFSRCCPLRSPFLHLKPLKRIVNM